MKLSVLQEKGVDIQKDLIGIFFEDINYGADGGIYAEMIENRSFEFVDARGDNDAYFQIYDGMYGWEAFPKGEKVNLSISTSRPQNQVNPHYLKADLKKGQGFTNKAYDGICAEKGRMLKLSFWARTNKDCLISVGLVNGENFYDEETVHLRGNSTWKKYQVSFCAKKDVRHELFCITANEDAEIDFDCISLFPQDAVCGIFRKDLMEKLEELNPKFIRFPGGCVVEGNELTNSYQWKNTVGDISERKANWNRWAVHGNNKDNHFHSKYSHYNQTLGLGYYEYFLMCEHLGAKALPVANVGLACQYQSSQRVLRDNPHYQDYIQDVLDLIEFANGSSDSKWGSVRAGMGHEAPFGLEYIGIGNEQWQTERVDFFERYDDFEKAIHAKYPEIKLIGSAGPTVFTPTYDAAWKNFYEKKDRTNYTYAVDEHYYMEPDWFLKNTHFYDKYDRSVKVFSGEYAAHDPEVKEDGKRNNFRCALAEAAFLTGVERNADVVYLSSYAPLFSRIGYTQWAPDLIWFDDKASYGTPSFYVQKLFSNYMGNKTLKSTLENGEENGVFQVVSQDEKNTYIKLVNTSDKDIKIELEGVKRGPAKTVTLKAGDLEYNSIEEPLKVAPIEGQLDLNDSLDLPAKTFLIINY